MKLFFTAMLLLAACAARAQTGGFALSQTVGVGQEPACVVAADINGDGAIDLISANGDNTLTVLTNNGHGLLSLAATLPVGAFPECVTAADVNGDGKMDLISANYEDGTLSVLTNNGKGIFTLVTNISVGASSGVMWVAAADLSGHGNLDLVCANSGSNTLTLLTNNGRGGFFLSTNIAVGSQPYFVAAADLNGDGNIDLVSVNNGSDNLTVLTNAGNGSFALCSSPAVGEMPYAVAVADINGDGRTDLICADSGNNNLMALTNRGNGTFNTFTTLATGESPQSVAVADFNGDGFRDVVSANTYDSGNTLSVLTNGQNRGFTGWVSPVVGNLPFCVVAADINGDGWPDLISANLEDDTLTILTNAGSFALSAPAYSRAAGFEMALHGMIGQPYTVQASSNLITWVTLQTNLNTNNIWRFADSSPAPPRRFYRAVLGALPLPTNAGPVLSLPAYSRATGFQMALNGMIGQTYTVQASSNLLTWIPLQTNINTNNIWIFADPAAATLPHRFYRAVQP